MKKTLVLVLVSMLMSASVVAKPKKTQMPKTPWMEADSIVNAIRRTSFPDKVYNISDFGAKAFRPDAPVSLAHDAINLAITVCNQNGGGTVVIPDSTYVTGPITLLSNVRLHLSDGARLNFSTTQSLYFPGVLTRWEGIDCYNARPLIYAYGAENIAITGKGVLDAQGSNSNWWAMCGSPRFGWKPGMISQSGTDGDRTKGPRAKLLEWGERQVPVHERVFGPEDGMRPQFVNLYRCHTVLIEDVTLRNSPFWVLHPLFCDDLIVRGVKIYNEGPNGDGCDPESCNRVLIEDCVFHTGDDCIAIKSGRNMDGRKWDTPSQNIVVRRCSMEDGHGGVVVGSEISGGYRNLYVEDCVMDSPELERVIRIKTNSCRSGIIENIYVRNVKVGRCKEAVLRINLNYEPKEQCQRGNNPIVRNVNLENVTCQESQFGVILNGLEDACNIYDINLKDCQFEGVKPNKKKFGGEVIGKEGKYRNIKFENLIINGEKISSPEDVK
ncbi:MAG: glycoside hydrolase family 28 protein [Bacteroidales bacterium]|nr:glycoside hydrolase family 28 protein [Candidatus Liminaster caballi]